VEKRAGGKERGGLEGRSGEGWREGGGRARKKERGELEGESWKKGAGRAEVKNWRERGEELEERRGKS